jgi:uncharacterized protein YbaP (TraB family)
MIEPENQVGTPGRAHAYFARPLLRAALACFTLCTTAHAEPALWLAQSKTAKVYLFGTMHILPKKSDWFTGKIAHAFAASTVLMEEADVGLTDPSALQGIMAQAMSPDTDIWTRLTPASATKFHAEVQKCGLPDEAVGHFKPWFASMLPAICALMSAGSGELTMASSSPEAALIEKAKQGHMAMDFFETPAQQIAYLSSASDAVQIKELESAINDGDNTGDAFTGMEASWLAGDVPAIARDVATMRAQGADFYDMIFTQRNVRFAARIAQALKGSQTVFVAIGAGHLAGPDSVQAQLGKLHVETMKQ